MRMEDNPRNYVYDERHKDDPLCPDGMVPKIPNMPINANPDWVDWVAGLRHDKPANLTEAVEQIYFNAICFGGDMGPNGNTYWGVDEGMVWTNDAIDEDVELVRSVTKPVITGDTSDGYHTFNSLYHHRAVLFSVIVHDHKDMAWKSKLHHDGSMYEGMFIVGIETPDGQATYHYDVDPYWDMFDCKELDRAPEWDGHTSDDAIARIGALGARTCETCKHAHITIDGKHCKWCSIMATHDIDSDEWSGTPNGYDPEPYFDADFFCGNYEPKEG